jgi:protein O-GlcNAc transferase
MNTKSLTQNYIGLSGAGVVLSEEQQFQDINVQTANKLHKEGKLTEAKFIYEKIFSANNEKFEVLHLLGTLEAQLGNFARAIDLLELASSKEFHYWDTFFNLGNAYTEIGNYEKAIVNYQKSLMLKNNNDVIYNNLGRAFHHSKNFKKALKNYNEAIKINGNNDKYHFNKGFTLIELKNLEQALECFDRAIKINNKELYYYYNQGLIQFNLEKFQESLISFDEVIKISPDFANGHLCKADVLVRLNQKILAENSYHKSLEINPELYEAHYNLGVLKLQNDNEVEALKHFLYSLKIKPDFAKALTAIGIAKLNNLELNEAIEIFSKAISIDPKDPGFYLNRGNAYASSKKYKEAFDDYGKAIEIKSDYYQAYSNRGGILLSQLNQPEAALILFDVAIGIKPSFVDAHINKAEALNRLGMEDLALNSFLKALEIDSNAPYIIGKCLHYKMKLCEWDGLAEGISIYEKMIYDGIPAAVPFDAINISDNPEIHLISAKLAKGSKATSPKIKAKPYINSKNEKIKLGFYSADLYYHPVAIWLAEQLENFDKNKFELFAFCFKTVHDPMQARLKAAFDHFIEVDKLSDIEVVHLSRELRIDIALDLNGQTADGRPQIFYGRAAPIQVNHIGFPGTMASDYIDYIIVDEFTIDKEYRKFYTEKFACVPCGYTYDRKRVISQIPLKRSQFNLPENVFVFTCQNGPQKISPEVFDVWMSILREAPNSVLWLQTPNQIALKNLYSEAEKRNVCSSRIIFNQREVVSIDKEKDRIGRYLASYKLADLFLDTWPYNAGTTAVDALWAGLPVLTKTGKSIGGRMATSALAAVEMIELITKSEEQYKNTAIGLALNKDLYNNIKNKLQQKILTAPLFNTINNTKNIENAFIEMYKMYQKGEDFKDFKIN